MNIVKHIAFVLTISFAVALTAQMPEWKLFIDRDGNRYFLDSNMKIYVDADGDTPVRPVSSRGLDYNLHLADEMVRYHRKADALTIWKSILRLEPLNMRIIEAQEKSSQSINSLMRNEGTRYPAIDEEAANLFVRDGDTVRFYNDFFHYSIKFEGHAVSLRRNIRKDMHSSYHGVTIGVQTEGDPDKDEGPYDYLAAFDSIRFRVNIKDVQSFESYRRSRDTQGISERDILISEDKLLVYEISAKGPQIYSGFEIYSISGNRGTHARFITPEERFEANRGEMLRAVESFKKTGIRRGGP